MKIKEIKEQAKIGLKGNFFKSIFITLFYTIITILAGLLTNNINNSFSNTNIKLLFDILIGLINLALLPFSYGVISSLINIFKGKKVDYTEFINISLLSYFKVIKIILSVLFKILPYIFILAISLALAITDFNVPIINIITAILFLISILILFIKTLDFAFVLFVNYDNSNISCKEILLKSKSTIKNKKCKYLLLLLSFILWFALILSITYLLQYFIENKTILNYINTILIAIITPMITVSQYAFYDDLVNEKK